MPSPNRTTSTSTILRALACETQQELDGLSRRLGLKLSEKALRFATHEATSGEVPFTQEPPLRKIAILISAIGAFPTKLTAKEKERLAEIEEMLDEWGRVSDNDSDLMPSP